jgi:hypothetical protein
MVERQVPTERQTPIDNQSPRERLNETMGDTRNVIREPRDMMQEGRDAIGGAYGQVTSERPSTSTMGDATSKAREKVEEQRTRAAHGIEAAAVQLRDHAEQIPGGERTTEVAQKAADKIEHAAGFIRDAEVSDITGDLERLVRQHPTGALLTAAAVGFLAGRALRS